MDLIGAKFNKNIRPAARASVNCDTPSKQIIQSNIMASVYCPPRKLHVVYRGQRCAGTRKGPFIEVAQTGVALASALLWPCHLESGASQLECPLQMRISMDWQALLLP